MKYLERLKVHKHIQAQQSLNGTLWWQMVGDDLDVSDPQPQTFQCVDMHQRSHDKTISCRKLQAPWSFDRVRSYAVALMGRYIFGMRSIRDTTSCSSAGQPRNS